MWTDLREDRTSVVSPGVTRGKIWVGVGKREIFSSARHFHTDGYSVRTASGPPEGREDPTLSSRFAPDVRDVCAPRGPVERSVVLPTRGALKGPRLDCSKV